MRERYKWLIYGFVFGLLFPAISLALDLFVNQESISNLFLIVKGNPVLWIVSSAPLILSITFLFIGISRENLFRFNENLKLKNKELQKKLLDQAMALNSEINNIMEDLNSYTDQLYTITNNIQTGICMINRENKIEPGFNDAFIGMFGNKDYLNNNIVDMVFNTLPNDLKRDILEFFELCFINKTASVSMLNAANPVNEFDYLHSEAENIVSKTIKTKVLQVKNRKDEIVKILLTFEDVTFKKELKNEIKQKEEEYNRQYALMSALFGNDRDLVKRFIKDLEQNVGDLENKIKEIRQNEVNTDIISDLVSIVHSIKGEAFSLDFRDIAIRSGEFENYLKEIAEKPVSIGENLKILSFVEELAGEKRALDRVISKLSGFLREQESSEPGSDKSVGNRRVKEKPIRDSNSDLYESTTVQLLEKALHLINDKSAEECKKKSKLHLKTNLKDISDENYRIFKEIFLHLIRNSIAHGIENPEKRKEAGKDESGNINISIIRKDRNILLTYSDDGSGFDLEKIKNKIRTENLAPQEEIENMKDNEIIKYVFKDGFTTTKNKDMVSGAGAGMSSVKKNVMQKLNGKMSIANNPGKGIVVKMGIPV